MEKIRFETILFFDGVCGLCNKAVDIVIRLDKNGRIGYSPLQGEYIDTIGVVIDKSELSSLILEKEGKIYYQSEAVLEICKTLGFPYSVMGIAKIIPAGLRNKIYDIIARNRYRIFGKGESCRLPNPDEATRFID